MMGSDNNDLASVGVREWMAYIAEILVLHEEVLSGQDAIVQLERLIAREVVFMQSLRDRSPEAKAPHPPSFDASG